MPTCEIDDDHRSEIENSGKLEKFRLERDSNDDPATPVQRSNQLSYQANWERVICLICEFVPLSGIRGE